MKKNPATRRWAMAAALLLATPVLAEDVAVSGAELKRLWSDKELVSRSAQGQSFFTSLKSDGSATISGGTFSDTGVWRVTETGYCARWQQIRNGVEACFTVRRRGDLFILFDAAGKETGRIHAVR
jgi:hypothetical protein